MFRESRIQSEFPYAVDTGIQAVTIWPLYQIQCAGIAQLVERNLAKVEVAGSNPVSRSKYCLKPRFCRGFHFCGKEKSLAEWQSGYAAACKAVDAGSIPTSASISTMPRPDVEYAMLLLSSPSADAAVLATKLV